MAVRRMSVEVDMDLIEKNQLCWLCCDLPERYYCLVFQSKGKEGCSNHCTYKDKLARPAGERAIGGKDG